MRLPATLAVYIGRLFVFWFAAVFSGLALVVYLFDSIELIRRTQRVDVPLGMLLSLSALKLPHLATELVPFVVLFAAMLCFWRLSRSHELTVIRAAGVSVWQFLLPVMAVAIAIGALRVAVVNPVAAALYSRYETLEGELLRGRTSSLAVSATGFWLRQADGAGNSVVHALRVASREMELHEVIVWSFEGADRFAGRVDARSARLEPGAWVLSDAWVSRPERPSRHEDSLRLPTDMTPERIQDAFAAPETISVWELPGFIRTLEAAGFTALRHRLHLQRLLASPLLLGAMVLIAASVSLRPPRRGGALAMAVIGVGAGFLLFFTSNLVAALGLSRAIPVDLAAWTPAAVTALLGTALLLHLEDG
jgi:lipopolysaccharide export system permease protein